MYNNITCRLVLGPHVLCQAEEVKEWILSTNQQAKVETVECDLGSLVSVRKCADDVRAATAKVDILINNAGR